MIFKRIYLPFYCCLLLIIQSCQDQPATYNVTALNFPQNSVIQIRDWDSDQIISTSNIEKQFSFKIHDSKARYAQIFLSAPGINKFYWMYIAPGTHTLKLDAAKFVFPLISDAPENKEIAFYYAIRTKMSKLVEDSAAIATNNFNNATRENIAVMLAKTKEWDQQLADLEIDIVKTFALKYPASQFTPLLLLKLSTLESNPIGFKKVMELTSPEVQRSKPAITILKDINDIISVLPGSIIPDIVGADPSGKPFDKNILKKYNVVICWISYNNMIRREHKLLASLYKRYHQQGVEFIGVSMDKTKQYWTNIIQADGLIWPQYSDLMGSRSPNAKLSKMQIPYLFIIDEHKKILRNDVRPEMLDYELSTLLKQTK